MVVSSKGTKKDRKTGDDGDDMTQDIEIVDSSAVLQPQIDDSAGFSKKNDHNTGKTQVSTEVDTEYQNDKLDADKPQFVRGSNDSDDQTSSSIPGSSDGVVAEDTEISEVEESIRPKSFDEIIGRVQEKKTITLMIDAAKQRGDVIDHILFYGPPGLGKTTFAVSIANEVGSSLRITSGPAIDRQGDLAAILTNLRKNDILFIDEIHRLSRTIEEILYPAMEDGVIDIIMGKGPSAKTIRLNLEPFTLIGATTQIGKISSPMRERFGLVQRLDYFTEDDLARIVSRAASIESIQVRDDALEHIASRARGTGRVALRLYRRVRDYFIAELGNEGEIDVDAVDTALSLLGIDQYGLEDVDRKLLQIMYEHYNGGPVGLSTLSAAISEDISTISDVYEPFLLKLGFIKRTPRGRVLTEKGVDYVLHFTHGNGESIGKSTLF